MAKVKLKYYKYIINESFNSLTLLTLLLINITSIFQRFSTNFFENFIFYQTLPSVKIPLLFICILNTIKIVKIFDNDYMFYGRLKSTKEYYYNLIQNIIVSNSCIIFLNLISSLIIIFSFSFHNLSIPQNINGVNFIIICIYYFFKAYIVYLLLSILGALIYKRSNHYGFIGYLIIIIILLFNVSSNAQPISSIKNIPLNIFDYLELYTSSSLYKYASIFHDVIFFILYSIGVIILINIIKALCCKKKKDYLL